MAEGQPGSRFPHLPPGREPGPQSRRERWSAPVGIALLAVLALASLVGGAVLLVGGLTGGFDAGAALGGGAFFLLLGLALAWTAWLLRRRRYGGAPGHFSIATDTDETRRGGAVNVTLSISSPDQVKGERLEVGLVCVERYDYEHVSHSRNGTTRSRHTRQVTA